MAARENQGLQIALIVFVMLTIILIVTTFLFFQNYREEQTKNATLTEQIGKASGERDKANKESADYKALISGGGDLPNMTVAEAADAKKDFEVHGKNLAPTKQSYRGLVEFLASELQNANKRIAEAAAQAKEFDEKIKNDERAKVAEMAKLTEMLDTVKKDLEEERAKFNKQRKELTANSTTLADQSSKARKMSEETKKADNARINELKTSEEKLTKLLQLKNEEEDRKKKSTEVADGKITWVNQRSRTAWINLGSGDHLRRQTSFSVVSSDQSNPADADRKGKIEVVLLLGAHLAEARIVDDDLSDPIMPGDQIFSPTWEPGRAEHFGLAGKMDINRDGQSDRQRVRDLIALNGGVIDEEVADDGKKTGEMSINTKYLVLGDPPDPGDKSGDKGALLDSWTAIRTEAQTLGVRIINVGELLDYMGYKPEEQRTVQLGPSANSADFKPRMPEGVQRVRPGSSKPPAIRRTIPPDRRNE